jgi:hypothetical protein
MPSLTKSGKPRKVRSDKGKKRGPITTQRYVRGGRKFMQAGGITTIPVPVYSVAPAKKTRAGRPNPTKGYSRPAYKFMKSGGITNIPVPNYSTMTVGKPRAQRKPSAYNVYVKDNYRLVKSRHPGASSKEVMKLVASQWRSYKGSGYFF